MTPATPAQSGPSQDARHAGAQAAWMRWIGAIGIVTIAVMRCCIVFLPQLVFDTDPAQDQAPIAALGMGGSLLLDVVLLLACLVALIGERRGGRGLDPLPLALALIPMPVVLWHGSSDAGDLWRGSTWLAASVACVTIAHLARERRLRIVIAAALLAVIVPLLARGATQMTWEHDATVAAYEQTREDFLHMRGWESDSPAARIYERRLKHREPIGWFPSTNIYASLAGCAAVMFAGVAIVAFRAYRKGEMQSGGWFLMALLAIACAVALRFTTSMGAMLATIGGGALLVFLLCRDKPLPRLSGVVVLVMILVATLGVIVRGAVLPEGFLGEKSLLFRWHYLQAAAGIMSEHALLGVGPDGFQQAYTMHRPSRNPEEVISAHAMLTDWLVTLGLAGAAWGAMIIAMMLRTGAADRVVARDTPPPVALRLALVVAAFGLIPAAIIEWPALTNVDVFVRGLAIAGYVVAASMIAGMLSLASDVLARMITIAAGAVLLVHAQVEMTFFHGGSVVWMMAMTGLIAGVKPAGSAWAGRAAAACASLALLFASGWILCMGAIPAISQHHAMMDAARLLAPVRDNADAEEVVLRQRPLAAEELVAAYIRWPTNVQPLNAAVEQLLLAASHPSLGPPLGLLIRAEEIIARAIAAHDKPNSIVLAMNVHAALAAATDDGQQWTRAIALGRRMTAIDPHGVGSWRRLGDVLWSAGAKVEAADAYARALANSDNFALDEMKQLSAARRADLQARIDDARGNDK